MNILQSTEYGGRPPVTLEYRTIGEGDTGVWVADDPSGGYYGGCRHCGLDWSGAPSHEAMVHFAESHLLDGTHITSRPMHP